MREIKFRAWHKAERKMCDVQIINFDKGAFLLGINPGKDEIGYKYYVKAPKDGRFCTFDEFELLEYTGLKDKSGKEIYEGDILENPINLKGVIEHHEGRFVWKYRNKRGIELLAVIDSGLMKNKSIIGSIYQTPELIKI